MRIKTADWCLEFGHRLKTCFENVRSRSSLSIEEAERLVADYLLRAEDTYRHIPPSISSYARLAVVYLHLGELYSKSLEMDMSLQRGVPLPKTSRVRDKLARGYYRDCFRYCELAHRLDLFIASHISLSYHILTVWLFSLLFFFIRFFFNSVIHTFF